MTGIFVRRTIKIALAGLWLVMSGGPVWAQQAPPDLRADVEWTISAIAKESSDTVVLEATDLIAETQNGTPGVTLRNAALAFRDWGRIELGTVRAVERPAPAGHKRIAFLFPNVVELHSVNGELVPSPVNLTDASLTVDFVPQRDRLRRSVLTARNIEILEAKSTMTAQGLSITSELSPDAGDRWTSIWSLDVDGLWMRGVEADHLKVEKLAVRQSAEGLNLSALEGFASSLRNLQSVTDAKIDPEAALRGVVAALRGHGVLMSAMKQTIRIGGMDFVDPAKDQNFRFAGLVLEQDMRGFDQGTVDWRFVAEYAGLDTPQTTIDPRLFLTGLAVDLTIKGIPASQLLDAAAKSFDRTLPGQTDPELFALVKEISTAAGTSFQVNRLAFTMPRLAGQATAQFALDENATGFGSGEALVIFHGLDVLAQDIRSGRDSYDQQTTNTIMLLASLALPSRAPDGRSVQVLRVQFGRDGKLMVNGRDLTNPPPQQRIP